jgi:hypothetical protein
MTFFTIILVTQLLGFAQASLLLFGIQIPEYAFIDTALMEMIKLLNNFYDYTALIRASILARLFIVLFVVVFNFVLMSMFVAIINAHYDEFKKAQKKAYFVSQSKDIKQHTFVILIAAATYELLSPSIWKKTPKQSYRRRWYEFMEKVKEKLIKYYFWLINLTQEKDKELIRKNAQTTIKTKISETYKPVVYDVNKVTKELRPYMDFNRKSELFSSQMEPDSNALGIISRNFSKFNTENLGEHHIWLAALEQ